MVVGVVVNHLPAVCGALCAASAERGSLPRLPCRPFASRALNRTGRHTTFRNGGLLRAAEEKVEVVSLGSSDATSTSSESWIPVMKPEDLPKGTRKEVSIAGQNLLIFWYRNQIYAIESRSPAEGAYSEGFLKAKFTQDYCIECPTTGTLFSLKNGEIVSWYPNNPVLRVITPRDTCRALEIFPVKLDQDAVYVDLNAGALGAASGLRGGADSSLENNNVFAVEPKMYVQGAGVDESGPGVAASVATAAVALLAVGGLAAGGTAIGIYYESPLLIGCVWVLIIAVSLTYFLQTRQAAQK